jgi:hypothetical protein
MSVHFRAKSIEYRVREFFAQARQSLLGDGGSRICKFPLLIDFVEQGIKRYFFCLKV